jgi:hypothetical protein
VRKLLMLVLLAMIACSQSQPAAIATSATSAPSCRLPIYVDHADGTGTHGAFIDYPSGRMTVDPQGDGGRYYDRRFARWLPVDSHSVSPDQTHYAQGGATADGNPYLRIVDVASGAERVYSLPHEMYSVIGGTDTFEYTDGAVYLGVYGEGFIAALWVLDLASGTTTYAGDITGIGAIDGTTVWRSTRNPADPNAWSYVPGSPTNQIERLDLRDGSRQVWLYHPGHLVEVIGVDAGHSPIVGDIGSDRHTDELSILTSPTTQKSIYKGTLDTWIGYIAGVSVDSHGIWFGGDKGFYLFSDASGVVKVSGETGWPAGTCA